MRFSVLISTIANNVGFSTVVHNCWPSRITTLCYHGVIPKTLQHCDHGFYTTVSATEFRRQLEWLGRRFHVVSCAQIREHFLEARPLPPRPLLITFDDGYWNNFALAAPALRDYGFPATFFLSTNYIGSGDLFWFDDLPRHVMKWPGREIERPGGGEPLPLPPDPAQRREVCRRIGSLCKRVPNPVRLAYLEYLRRGTADHELPWDENIYRILNWDEVRELARQGFEIGSHTQTHPILAQLEEDAIGSELEGSRAHIEAELGARCFALAYPNGTAADYDLRIQRRTAAAGFDLAFTMADRPYGSHEDRYTISRLGVLGHVPMGMFTFSVSGARALARRIVHA